MERTNGYYRYQHKKHALRHKRITEEVYQEQNYFDTFNKYDSFKIHCSCPLCASKTNNRKGRCFGPRNNWSTHDKRNLEKLNYEEDDE